MPNNYDLISLIDDRILNINNVNETLKLNIKKFKSKQKAILKLIDKSNNLNVDTSELNNELINNDNALKDEINKLKISKSELKKLLKCKQLLNN